MKEIKEEQTKFGLSQIGNHTPQWAKNVFRVVLYLCSFLILALTTLNVKRIGLTPEGVNDIVGGLSFLTIVAHSLSKMCGVEVKPEDCKIG